MSSSYKARHLEFNTITDMLLRNGYPLYFIQNQISRFLDSKYCKFNFTQKNEKHVLRPRIILKLPLIGDHSLHVEKELQSFFHCYILHDSSLNVIHNCFKVVDMFKHKERQPKHLHSNVAYKLTRSCDSVYIGILDRFAVIFVHV